jgi:hypothetical protein
MIRRTTLNGWSMGSVPDIGDDQTYNFEERDRLIAAAEHSASSGGRCINQGD